MSREIDTFSLAKQGLLSASYYLGSADKKMRALAKEEVDRIICLIDSIPNSEQPCAMPTQAITEHGLDGVDHDALRAAAPDLLQCLKWMVGLYEMKCKKENVMASGAEYYASLNAISRATGGAVLTLQNMSQLFHGFSCVPYIERDVVLCALEALLEDYIRRVQGESIETGSGDVARENVLTDCESARNAAIIIDSVRGVSG